MLTDEQFSRATAVAIDTLHKYNFHVNNRALNILIQDILPIVKAGKLRLVNQDRYETLLVLIYSWIPDKEIHDRLKLTVIVDNEVKFKIFSESTYD